MIRNLLKLVLVCLAVVSVAGAADDRDSDGVVDARDECPNTEAGAPVTMRGCAHDADHDGVADYRDNCLASLPGRSVDAWGCPLAIEIPLKGVSFEVNSARLREDSYPALDRAAAKLLGYSNLRVEVAGHTDNTGTATHNRRLSRLRADAVRTYLISTGLASESVSAKGYGESRPIADNDTDAGRKSNRRVVLRILSGTVSEAD